MEIIESMVHKIVLDDKPGGYRPNKRTISVIRKAYPDCTVVGFGKYGFNDWWYLLIQTGMLPPNFYGIAQSLSMKKILDTKPEAKNIS